MSGTESLYALCDELLVAASQACELSRGGAMDRVYVSPGPPAWDCPNQLTVHAGGPAEADTAPLQPPLQPYHRVDDGLLMNMITLTITALRCAPSWGEAPSTSTPSIEALEEAAKETLDDVWCIWNHVATRKRDGTLFPPKKTRELIFDQALPLLTEGGIAGWQMQMRVQLDGFTTVTP